MIDETSSKGERTQAEIVAAANNLFMKNGFHGTSMRQIAEEAGIAVGGIYNHFANKDKIFTATFIRYHPFNEILPALIAAQGDTLEAFIRDAAHRMVAGFGQRMDFLNLMFIELVEFKGLHIPTLFQTFFPAVLPVLQKFAERGQEMRPIPMPIVVRTFMGTFLAYMLFEMLIGSNIPPEMSQGALDYSVDIFLHGIMNDKPPAE